MSKQTRHWAHHLAAVLGLTLCWAFQDAAAQSISPAGGNLGTEIVITGAGFGTAKGTVTLGGDNRLKVLSWTDTEVRATLRKSQPGGTYDVVVTPRQPKGAPPVVLPLAFTVIEPALLAVTPDYAPTGTTVTISGLFLGSKPGKLSLRRQFDGRTGIVKLKPLTWTMDAATGAGVVTFVIPATAPVAVLNLVVETRAGPILVRQGFAVGEPPVPANVFAIVLDPAVPATGTTGDNPLNVSGTVLDVDGSGLPATLEWSVLNGGGTMTGSVAVAGDGRWSGLTPLAAGDNQLRFRVPGTAVSRDLAITHNPSYQFGGALWLTADVAYLDEPREVAAYISLTDALTDPGDVRLVRVDGGVETLVTALTDDGNLDGGDEIESDHLYSGRFEVTESAATTVEYRVVVGLLGSGAEARSERREILVTAHLADEELAAILAQQEDCRGRLAAANAAGTMAETMDQMLAELAADPQVAEAGRTAGGTGLWLVRQSGVAGVVFSPAYESKGGAGDGSPSGLALAAPEPAASEIRSAKALAIAAQYHAWGADDDVPRMARTVRELSCSSVHEVSYGGAGAGSVEDFKLLGDYGMVLISTHGGSFFEGVAAPWAARFGWIGPFGQVTLHSNMRVDAGNLADYEDDLKRGRLVIWSGNYAITPSFVRYYAGNLPNSLVYLGACRTAADGSLAQALLEQGAGAVLGYSQYVSVPFTALAGPRLFRELFEPDSTLADAFQPGQRDPYQPALTEHPAELRRFGNGGLSLLVSGLNDGDFENANLNQAWTTLGDARLLTALGEARPTQGQHMAVISTGLGFTTSSGTLLQQFCLDADAATLSFDWNFFSEEFLEWVGSQYQDAFSVTLHDVDEPANSVILLSETVDSLAPRVTPVANSFDQGDVYATGWTNTVVAIPANLRGRKVQLRFDATDVGDSVFDTAVLIDRVVISPAEP